MGCYRLGIYAVEKKERERKERKVTRADRIIHEISNYTPLKERRLRSHNVIM